MGTTLFRRTRGHHQKIASFICSTIQSYYSMSTYISQLKNEEIDVPFRTISGFYLKHDKRSSMVKKFSEKIHFRCSIEKICMRQPMQ